VVCNDGRSRATTVSPETSSGATCGLVSPRRPAAPLDRTSAAQAAIESLRDVGTRSARIDLMCGIEPQTWQSACEHYADTGLLDQRPLPGTNSRSTTSNRRISGSCEGTRQEHCTNIGRNLHERRVESVGCQVPGCDRLIAATARRVPTNTSRCCGLSEPPGKD
jgi:hypothetical protein